MKSKLVILGASYLQLPLVNKAKEMGIHVICIAWDDGKAICKEYADNFYDISVLEKESILEICKTENIDGITTIATDICIPTIAYITEKLNLVGNSPTCATFTTDKAEMRKCLAEHHVRIPASKTLYQAQDFDETEILYPLIIKPADRSGSLGVVKTSNTHETIAAIDLAIQYSFSKKCIVEEFVSGQEVSVETISYQGSHQIITITDKVITDEPYFVELEHHQPSQLPENILTKITEISLQVLDATEVKNGASHIEMKINENGVFVIEIGSRMGGDFIGSDLVYLSTGFDFLKAVIDIALDQFDGKVKKNVNNFSGVYFLSENTKKLLPFFTHSENLEFEIVKKEILNQELKQIHSSNDRSGYLIYRSSKKVSLL